MGNQQSALFLQDFFTFLLMDGGGQQILVEILLLLPPRDLKAMRLVNKSLNEFIKDEVWGTNYGMRHSVLDSGFSYTL